MHHSIRACTRKAFDGSRSVTVEPFGSFVSGLSTWASDVDLVVTGLAEPSRITGMFSHGDRHYVAKCLERIAGQLRRWVLSAFGPVGCLVAASRASL